MPPSRGSRVRRWRSALLFVVVATVAVAAVAACGSGGTTPTAANSSTSRTPEFSVSTTFSLPAPDLPGQATPTPSVRRSPTVRPSVVPLAGRTIVLDPGHNGGNAGAAEALAREVDVGGFRQACDTVGSSTDAGYAEHAFAWDLANRTAALLRARGARVVLTRADDRGVGPCLDARAEVANRIPADVALSLHADGGPAPARGFDVVAPGLLPGRNEAVVGPSQALARAVHSALLSTNQPPADRVAADGYSTRIDLGGLALARVPTVFVECANMRNPTDAARLTDPAYRAQLAGALAAALEEFLFGR